MSLVTLAAFLTGFLCQTLLSGWKFNVSDFKFFDYITWEGGWVSRRRKCPVMEIAAEHFCRTFQARMHSAHDITAKDG